MTAATACLKTGHLVRTSVLVLILTLSSFTATHAVILKGDGDPESNTKAPAGALFDSGWQYQGNWGGCLGTPVAPQYFVAARHVGGVIGQTFEFCGASYHAVALYDDPNTDLRLWKVDGTFPYWAPLYLGNDEIGKPLLVFGRGTQRGDPVVVPCVQTNLFTNVVNLRESGLNKKQAQQAFPDAKIQGQLMTVVTLEVVTNDSMKGWKAGVGDGRMRWGQNHVLSTGSFIAASFDFEGGENEAYLSSGDSSGGLFIQENGVWKLAGINYGVEGPYSTSPEDPWFYGAIFDTSGLYGYGMPVPYDDNGQRKPACFYATRISPRLPWIMSIIGQ